MITVARIATYSLSCGVYALIQALTHQHPTAGAALFAIAVSLAVYAAGRMRENRKRPAKADQPAEPLDRIAPDAYPSPAVRGRAHRHCQFCGRRIAGGKFCTGEHGNLFISMFGSPEESGLECTKGCRK